MHKKHLENLMPPAYILFTILSAYSIIFMVNSLVVYAGILLTLSLHFLLAMSGFRKMTLRSLFIIVLFMFTYVVLMLFGNGYSNLNFQMISILFLVFFVLLFNACNRGRIKMFMDIYERIVFYIACLSLFMYLFATIIKVIPSSGYIDYLDWSRYYGYKNFWWLYFEGQSTNLFGIHIMRNISLFAEGPIFSCILTIALYIELFICKKGRIYLFVFLAAMLTTFSTTSLAVGSVLLFIKFYNRYLKNKRLIVVAPIILGVIVWFVALILIDKLQTTNLSGSIRIDDIKACFQSFANSPWVGNGFKNIEAMSPYRASWIGNMAGNSTGIGEVFSNGGLALGIWYCAPLLIGAVQFCRYKEMRSYYGLVMLIFLIFFIMIIHYTGLGSFLLALQWAILVGFKRKDMKKHIRRYR